MPTDYTGDSAAAQYPSAAPGPGVSPTVEMPASGDDLAVASVQQDFKVLADFEGFIQDSVRLENPADPSVTSGIGRSFTEVVKTGTGSGTVKPTAGPGYYGYRYRVLITLAGATGAAKFKVSTDGGASYGTENTTAASYSDPSGITIAFSGTFDLNTYYEFRGIDTPLALWHEDSAKARETIDHLGYLLGQSTSFREDWGHSVSGTFVTGSSAVQFPGYSRWTYTLGTATPAPSIAIQNPNADALGNFCSLLVSASTSTSGTLENQVRTTQAVLLPSATCTAVFAMQWLVRNPAGSAAQTLYAGLMAPGVGLLFSSTHHGYAAFTATGTGNWFATVANFAESTSTTDTGITPNRGVASDWQLLRIEYYGGASTVGTAQGGATWRFLIDGVQVALHQTNTLAGNVLHAAAELMDTGNTPLDSFELGPVSWAVNWLDDPVRM